MNKILMLLTVSSMVAGSAVAGTWEPHGTAPDGAKCFYKPSSLVKDKGVVRVWERRAATKSDLDKGIAEARQLTELDCDGRRYKTLITVMYPADKTKGVTVSGKEGEWAQIAPDSVTDALAKAVCAGQRPESGEQAAR